MTPAERKELKAGKHERIRKLLDNIRASQQKLLFEDRSMVGDSRGSDMMLNRKGNQHT